MLISRMVSIVLFVLFCSGLANASVRGKVAPCKSKYADGLNPKGRTIAKKWDALLEKKMSDAERVSALNVFAREFGLPFGVDGHPRLPRTLGYSHMVISGNLTTYLFTKKIENQSQQKLRFFSVEEKDGKKWSLPLESEFAGVRGDEVIFNYRLVGFCSESYVDAVVAVKPNGEYAVLDDSQTGPSPVPEPSVTPASCPVKDSSSHHQAEKTSVRGAACVQVLDRASSKMRQFRIENSEIEPGPEPV